MPIYNYKGYDAKSGANRKGKIEADSPKAAKAKLRKVDKVIVSDLKEEASIEKIKGKKKFFQENVSLTDLAIMTRQFATLQSAHIPLDETLKALTDQVENVVLRNTLSAVKDSVSEGKSLADSLSPFPRVFDRLYINMVRAGESAGTLGVVMERLADYMEKTVEARGQILSAMAYPAVMMIAILGAIVYMLVSLIPQLEKVFRSMKVTLPWYTQFVIDLSGWLQSNWFMVPVGLAVAYYAGKKWYESEKGRRQFDVSILHMPVFGALAIRLQIARFTETLSTLLNSGVPIIRALEITKNTLTNSVIADVIEESKIAVQEGKDLGGTIEKSGRFPPLVTHMIMTGERTGQLEEMLKHVAVAYEAEVKRKIDAMIALIEPALIVFMMSTAGGLMGAVLVPMLGIMNQIR